MYKKSQYKSTVYKCKFISFLEKTAIIIIFRYSSKETGRVCVFQSLKVKDVEGLSKYKRVA